MAKPWKWSPSDKAWHFQVPSWRCCFERLRWRSQHGQVNSCGNNIQPLNVSASKLISQLGPSLTPSFDLRSHPFLKENQITTTFPKENLSMSPSSKKKSIIKETGYCPPNAAVGGSRSICEASVRLIHLSEKCRKFQALQGNQRPNDRAGREPVPYEEMMEPCGEWNVD